MLHLLFVDNVTGQLWNMRFVDVVAEVVCLMLFRRMPYTSHIINDII